MRFMGKQTMQDAILEYHELREAGENDPIHLHRLISAFVELCNSVAYAHSKQIIHRDLKPENVALDSYGQVILLDWGLAKIDDDTGAAEAAFELVQEESENLNLTTARQVLGSPMYMSPEQAAGRIDDIDERTDVYGLGGILFAILTGQAPHEPSQSHSENSGLSDLLSEIVGGEVLSARSFVSNIPRELDAICQKALQKKRCLRYPSAAVMAEDVERFLAGREVIAYREPVQQRIQRWISEHPRWSQSIALLVACVFLAAIITGYVVRQTQLAESNYRFQQAADIAKELVFHLQTQADNGIKDTRFLTGLRPVQEIVALESGNGIDSESPLTNNPKDDLASISEALLHRNEAYLAIGLLKLDEQTRQVLRVARNPGANLIRRVPSHLLESFSTDESFIDYFSLLPGDVVLQTSDKVNPDAPTEFRDALSLTVLNTIFDDSSGEYFGLMAIQLDLRGMMQDRIEETRHDRVNVYVTDGDGIIQMVLSEGEFQTNFDGKPIATLIPEASHIFGGDPIARVYSDGSTVFAKRIRLGEFTAKSKAEVGVVVHVDL